MGIRVFSEDSIVLGSTLGVGVPMLPGLIWAYIKVLSAITAHIAHIYNAYIYI